MNKSAKVVLGSVAGSPCGYNNPTLNRWRLNLLAFSSI
jgi:hypothetical protein